MPIIGQLSTLGIQNLHDVENNTIVALLDEIKKDRRGETVDKALLKNILRMLSSLQMYHSSFEKLFLQQTEDFYRAESSRYLQQADVSGYRVCHPEASRISFTFFYGTDFGRLFETLRRPFIK